MIKIPQSARIDILKIIDEEGGWVYTNHPIDPDRGTYAGVRYKVFETYYRNHLSPYESVVITPRIYKDMAAQGTLKDTIIDIYYANYYLQLNINEVPDNIKMPLFSAGVNMGVRRVSIILQRSINKFDLTQRLKVDGIIGVKTLNALDHGLYKPIISTLDINEKLTQEIKLSIAINKDRFRNLFVHEWCQRYVNIVIDDPKDIVFLNGWFNRANKYWVY